MRQLTTKQKRLLLKTLNTDYQDHIRSVDDLPEEVWKGLEMMNDSEILYTEVNRYIDDYRFSKAYDTRRLRALKMEFC